MADYIPEDVLINVLMRLPVEAIVRFTLVCKSWFSLITSPNFISHYLNQTIPYNNSNNGHLLVQYCTVQEHYSLQFDGNNTFHEYKKFDFPLTCLSPHFSIVGSCNGLICISDDQLRYNLGMHLWNLCIRKAVAIPNPNITFASHFRYSLGFGFDSVTNDFKVVRILHLGLGHDLDIEVYTLKSGCWRSISFGKAMPYVIEESSKQAYVNGAAHWIAYDLSGDNYSMVSFDMSNEVFQVMSVPDLIARWDLDKEMHLFLFRESISLIKYWFVWGRDSHCSIWVMNEYGVA